MVLSMARPWRDPASGMFYLRTRVPRDVVDLAKGTTAVLPVGTDSAPVRVGEMVKLSLRTRDPGEAKARHAAAMTALGKHFKALQSGPVRLTRRQIVAIAGTVYADHMDLLGDEPGERAIWDRVLALHAKAREAGKLEEWVGPLVDEELAKLQIIAHPESRAALIDEVDRALVQQAAVMARFADGDFRPDPDAARFPDAEAALAPLTKATSTASAKPEGGGGAGLSILSVWEKYKVTPPLAAASTTRRWEPGIKAFHAFIKRRGMETVTAADAMLFIDHRVAAGISPVSAGKVDLAAVKRMFSFAQARGWLAVNPLAGLRREKRGNEEERDREGRDFRPWEYRRILSRASTIRENPGKRGDALVNAIRWVPWICAYSGARPGEAIQLRKEDFGVEEGIAYHYIRKSAGTVKTGKPRKTPVHRHLVEMGLLDFVRAAPEGHLFAAPQDGSEKAVRKAVDLIRGRLGEWVRSIGVTDTEISPNHAWRHTFKTIASDVGLPEKVVDAICGHAPSTQGRKYGQVSLQAKAAAIAEFPVFDPTEQEDGSGAAAGA